ncbi:hypothetical protein RFI_13272 [Reticulomyxa filosa]|uniref:Uncharacterized protein n=1 Tax=Reticulomyxa filosa TaxID=46433 RepID=X6ND62_RETFI|nr:hypothetical protein RFI_13272 [Reticulomyxa filosa]|eukprot:ETO23886.1 hypothetical protein RFI_13272 [Reticulomyxa filosa]
MSQNFVKFYYTFYNDIKKNEHQSVFHITTWFVFGRQGIKNQNNVCFLFFNNAQNIEHLDKKEAPETEPYKYRYEARELILKSIASWNKAIESSKEKQPNNLEDELIVLNLKGHIRTPFVVFCSFVKFDLKRRRALSLIKQLQNVCTKDQSKLKPKPKQEERSQGSPYLEEVVKYITAVKEKRLEVNFVTTIVFFLLLLLLLLDLSLLTK